MIIYPHDVEDGDWEYGSRWWAWCLRNHATPVAELLEKKLPEEGPEASTIATKMLGNAVEDGEPESMAVLMRHGADPYQPLFRPQKGQSAMDLVIRKLSDSKPEGEHALFMYVLLNKERRDLNPAFMVDNLNSPLFDPDESGRHHETALTYAIQNQYFHCIEWLLRNMGVSATAPNEMGQIPLEVALAAMPRLWGTNIHQIHAHQKTMAQWRRAVILLIERGGFNDDAIAASGRWSRRYGEAYHKWRSIMDAHFS
jgi:hypothetical protein